MNMKKSIIEEAVKIAKKKLKDHPEFLHFPHYSFIIQGNKLVEWATNNRGVPPIHYGYNQKTLDKTFVPKLHSEVWAYKRARGLLTKAPFEIINIRLNRYGEIRLSKPCKCCYGLLTALGCKRFYFSSANGFISL